MTAIDKHALNSAELESALQELKRISEQPSVGTHYARVLRQHIASLNGELGAAKDHIAELESNNASLQNIAHDYIELAISTQLDRNAATLEMRILHKRLAELEARTYVPLPLNIEDEYQNHEYVAGWNDCRNAASVRQQTPAVCDVIAECYRQQSVEGWTPEHDDGLTGFQPHCVAGVARGRGRVAAQSAGCGAAKSPVDVLSPGDEQSDHSTGD